MFLLRRSVALYLIKAFPNHLALECFPHLFYNVPQAKHFRNLTNIYKTAVCNAILYLHIYQIIFQLPKHPNAPIPVDLKCILRRFKASNSTSIAHNCVLSSTQPCQPKLQSPRPPTTCNLPGPITKYNQSLSLSQCGIKIIRALERQCCMRCILVHMAIPDPLHCCFHPNVHKLPRLHRKKN